MIQLHNLKSDNTAKNNRVGRGISAGRGKTAGRGTKGQKSRSGYNLPRRFEGGQSALIQRLPKIRGFKSHAIKPIAINIKKIDDLYKDNEMVNVESLTQKGLINKLPKAGIKIIGNTFTKTLQFEGVVFSKNLETLLAEKTDKPAEKKAASAK